MKIEIKMCPICSEPIPNREHAGKYCGAISRKDNVTEICSACGNAEAMADLQEYLQELQFDEKRADEEMERIEKFEREHQDDDGISDRERRADYLYESGYSDRVGLDSFAYDNHGNDTGLRESDFI